ncbi:MAG: hypothetical protein K2K39_03300 [Clostridia bacterium]|nr:hypothetical protein [Clostridia bacterium]
MKEKSAIMQIFYGQRGSADKLKSTPEYRENLRMVNNYYEKLCEILKDMPEALALLEKFNEYSGEVNASEVDGYYLEGFKFGLLIGIEAGESKFGE